MDLRVFGGGKVDRRQDSEADRRVIERVSNPALRLHFRQINVSVRFLAVLILGSALFVLVKSFGGAAKDLTFGLFVVVVLGVLASILFRLQRAIRFYLQNESAANLDRAMEVMSVFWMTAAFVACLYAILSFVLQSNIG